jgi:hypothetical protein
MDQKSIGVILSAPPIPYRFFQNGTRNFKMAEKDRSSDSCTPAIPGVA